MAQQNEDECETIRFDAHKKWFLGIIEQYGAQLRSIHSHLPGKNQLGLLFLLTKIAKMGTVANPVNANAPTKYNGKVSDTKYKFPREEDVPVLCIL